MTASLIALIATLRSTLRSRLDLEAEILALRHQLAVLHRQAPRRPRLRQVDRLLWVVLSRLWPNWRRAIQIVTPETVVFWHRRAFALAWSWKSRRRRPDRPAVAADLSALIRQMQAANPQGATLAEARANLGGAVRLVLEANRTWAQEDIGGTAVIREPLKLTA